MNDFVQDLWQDLRDKRLVPVAAALILAIVAIPVVLTESSAEPPPAASTPPSTDVAESPGLALDTATAASSGTGSELNVFSPDDPFVPPKAVTRQKDSATATAAGSKDAGASDGGSGSSPGGSKQGGSGGGSRPVAPAPVGPPKTSEFEYVADVTFWNGDRRSERRLRKLDMLPSSRSPVLIFVGATEDGGNAVFLVDSTLSATGEGSCRPNASNCVYVHIGPGAEHLFTTEEGDSYRVRVDEIRRVKVRAGASTRERPAASASTGPGRRFSLPSLVDLVVETSATGTPSSIGAGGR